MGNIRPSSDLRNKYLEMSSLCKETKEPIYITVNSGGNTALVGITEYRQTLAELELLRTLAEANEDIENGRVTPANEVFSHIRNSKLKSK